MYGACRHKTKFHRYKNSIFVSADESHQGSKIIEETSNRNLTSQCIKCTNISTYTTESEYSSIKLALSPSTDSSLDTPRSTSSRDTHNNFMNFDVWFFFARVSRCEKLKLVTLIITILTLWFHQYLYFIMSCFKVLLIEKYNLFSSLT